MVHSDKIATLDEALDVEATLNISCAFTVSSIGAVKQADHDIKWWPPSTSAERQLDSLLSEDSQLSIQIGRMHSPQREPQVYKVTVRTRPGFQSGRAEAHFAPKLQRI